MEDQWKMFIVVNDTKIEIQNAFAFLTDISGHYYEVTLTQTNKDHNRMISDSTRHRLTFKTKYNARIYGQIIRLLKNITFSVLYDMTHRWYKYKIPIYSKAKIIASMSNPPCEHTHPYTIFGVVDVKPENCYQYHPDDDLSQFNNVSFGTTAIPDNVGDYTFNWVKVVGKGQFRSLLKVKANVIMWQCDDMTGVEWYRVMSETPVKYFDLSVKTGHLLPIPSDFKSNSLIDHRAYVGRAD